ncbi:uncharacterized protein MYCFIDRAFT_59341 [Pseudocercospora fijiensis CIRAD86]|uniref:ER membrane protein complex subunit 7 beta-sandwich domain-containing protein n=1 Tax=Pseudocercospora fijiensis (strain CIRAD86) TaxID=383855 RepID=M3A4S9_PSEFD|nr:uncharacterized protein MYCFIDRAFT_59341 [Pseudocercospora fijiensis CIRAD86]EME86129.1 hypothetical protein MYCFIDRAFT_59341 [Pseudocercospora fijiensis CIRAD86]
MANFRAAILLAIAASCSAAKLTVSIPPSQLLENPYELPASTHAVLLGPPGIRYDAPLRRDNTFVFPDLPDASYLLTLHSRDFFFPPLRVDVIANPEENAQNISAWQTFRGNEWSNKGHSFGEGKDELKIDVIPAARKDFYQQRGGFNVLGFLKSPMILMALFSVVMIFGLPYLMDNMDPEAKAEFEEMSKKSPLTGSSGAASQMQNFDLAGFLAGRSSAPAEQPAPAASGGKKR